MTKTYHLFVPEYVPLENKGEEAIVRGIADTLFPEGNCEIHLLEVEAHAYRLQDGIHVYPAEWFFPTWATREFGLGPSWEKLRDSACSLVRNGLHKLWPGWVKRRSGALRETVGRMRRLAQGDPPRDDKDRALLRLVNCDYVVAGHDGALDEMVCHVINSMRDLGKGSGILGVELPRSFKSRAILEVHQEALRHCEFFYCRTAASVEVARRSFPDVHSELLPDPAFGMKPAPDGTVDKIIEGEGLGHFFERPVVMCTCCEPAPIARHCFEDVLRPDLKLAAHRQLFAEVIRHIVHEHGANVLFLPHAVGPGAALDDRVVARDILSRAELPPERARLLATACSAPELKGLLKRGELLLAERIHSVIGATGAHTPFFFMGSHTDRRVQGIVNEMLGMEHAVYFLNRPDLADLKAKFDAVWSQRAEQRARLTETSASIRTRLEEGAAVIRRRIG